MTLDEIETQLEAEGYLVILWHVNDVKGRRPDLNERQCREVLRACKESYDPCVGLDIDLVRIHAEELFPHVGE